MEFLQKKITTLFGTWRETGLLTIVYALGVEAVLIGYLYFLGFFMIETLLPTFVTARLSLTWFFFLLTFAAMLLALLGRFLDVSFPLNLTGKNPLLWMGGLLALGILGISLIKFPPFLILVILALLFLCAALFWNIFFGNEQKV